MKIFLFVIGILLGIGGSSLYIWMKPKTDDPYFFLSPKVVDGIHSINIPIALYEKGSSVNSVFWMTPLPQQKYFYLFPTNDLLTRITLDTENKSVNGRKISPYEIFEQNNIPEIKNKTPMLSITLYKIHNDLSESVVFNETKLFDSSKLQRNFNLLTMKESYGHGQFRLKITVLGDWPELKHDELTYVVKISASALK